MSKTLLVLRNELRRIIFRRSFILVLILLPVVSVISFLTVSYIREREATTQAENGGGSVSETTYEGFVDLSGIIQEMPTEASDYLEQYATVAEAQGSLDDGFISAYYVIPQDYLETGQIIYYRPDFNPLSQTSHSSALEFTLAYNLLEQNPDLTQRIENPLANLEQNIQSKGPQRELRRHANLLLAVWGHLPVLLRDF